jgi:hypothetical protein
MAATLLLLALVAAQSRPLPASPIEDARIVRHSPRPCCGSGVFHFTVTYEVEARDGARYLLYETYAGADDSIMPPGSRCTIWFAPHDGRTIVHEPHGEETGGPHLLIQRMLCRIGELE